MSKRRKAHPVTVIRARAVVNYTHLAAHVPTEAARAYWARKVAEARAVLEPAARERS